MYKLHEGSIFRFLWLALPCDKQHFVSAISVQLLDQSLGAYVS